MVQQGWFISHGSMLVSQSDSPGLEGQPSKCHTPNDWLSYQLEAQVRLWAEGHSNFPNGPLRGLVGLPHSMVTKFQESKVDVHGVIMTWPWEPQSLTSTVLCSLVLTKLRNQVSLIILSEEGVEVERSWEGRSVMGGPWKASRNWCYATEALVTWAQFPQNHILQN